MSCRYYMRGKCTYGTRCKYSHIARGPTPKDEIPCKFYVNGCCRNQQCEFFHAGALCKKYYSGQRCLTSCPYKHSKYDDLKVPIECLSVIHYQYGTRETTYVIYPLYSMDGISFHTSNTFELHTYCEGRLTISTRIAENMPSRVYRWIIEDSTAKDSAKQVSYFTEAAKAQFELLMQVKTNIMYLSRLTVIPPDVLIIIKLLYFGLFSGVPTHMFILDPCRSGS